MGEAWTGCTGEPGHAHPWASHQGATLPQIIRWAAGWRAPLQAVYGQHIIFQETME